MNDKARVIERIKKLLALSESANEHEAALAAEKAQELLAEYNIDMFDIQETEDDPTAEVHEERAQSRPQAWRRSVYMAVAKMYFCEYYFIGGVFVLDPNSKRGRVKRDTHCFVGKPHNTEVAKLMAAYLCATILRLSSQGSHQYPKSERARYKKSFHNAASHRLYWRIMDRIEKAKKEGLTTAEGRNLPALLSMYDQEMSANQSWINDHVGSLKTSTSKTKSTHLGGIYDGRDAAENSSLDPQVKDSKTKTARLR